MANFKWTEQANELLKLKYPDASKEELLTLFPTTYVAIQRQASALGIKRSPRKWTKSKIDKLKRLYSIKNNGELAKIFSTSIHAINVQASKLGLKKPDKYFSDLGKIGGPLSRKHYFDTDFFETINTPEKAYFLGFIQADGCITQQERCGKVLSFQIHKKDIDVMQKFLSVLNARGIELRNSGSHYVRLSLCSNKLVNDLLKHGVAYKKSYSDKFPKIGDNSLLSHYIRGVFDGDGSVYQETCTGHPTCYIMGRLMFCKWVQEAIGSQLDISTRIYKQKGDVCTLRIRRERDVKRFFEWLYLDATVYLERKKRKFEELLGRQQYEVKKNAS